MTLIKENIIQAIPDPSSFAKIIKYYKTIKNSLSESKVGSKRKASLLKTDNNKRQKVDYNSVLL